MYQVTITFDDRESLDVTMSISRSCSYWNERARTERAAGNEKTAQTCERISGQHAALWDKVHDASEVARLKAEAKSERMARAANKAIARDAASTPEAKLAFKTP